MKFWLTVVVGVVAVAAGSTALMVMNPTAHVENPGAPTAPAVKNEPIDADPAKWAVAEVEGSQSSDHGIVGQHQAGQDVFKIRNNGKSRSLIVTPMKATCHCTDVYLADHEPSPSEPAPDLKRQYASMEVKPGKMIYVVARWNTKDKISKQNVGVPVTLDGDPRKTEIQFRITLDIHKEIVLTGDILEFGPMNEGEKKTASSTITSLIRDKFDIEKIDVEAKGFLAKALPMNPVELKEAGARSGYKVLVEATGEAPVGAVEGLVGVQVKTPQSTEQLRITLLGRVMGDIETEPQGARIRFGEVTADTYKPQIIKIFARKLKEGEGLRVGTVKPSETLDVKLEKNPKLPMWVMTVGLKPGAPGGTIKNGSISVADSTGRDRLVFQVQGIIDPAFSRATASR